jgi:hypothetical protein
MHGQDSCRKSRRRSRFLQQVLRLKTSFPNPKSREKNDPVAVFLLVCVTLSYLLKFPGLPAAAGLQWLSTLLPADYFSPAVLMGRWFFAVVPAIAAVYSALRPNPVRIALIVGGLLVLALWFVSPMLRAAIATT